MFDTSMSTDSPVLPAELILRIFGQLDPRSRDDRSALVQCTLISGVFRHDAQKQLYSSVNLTYYIGNDPDGEGKKTGVDTLQSNRFRLAITGSPTLRTFVRELDIHLTWNLSRQMPSTPETFSLSVILSCMTKLEVLNWHAPHGLSWMYYSKAIQSSIQAILLANNLRKIDFVKGLGLIPLSLLCSSSNLKQLAITDPIHTELLDVVQPPGSLVLTNLTARTLRSSLQPLVQFLQTPKCPITLSKLQSLNVRMAHRSEHEQVRAILDMCAKSLSHLYCNFLCAGSDPSFSLTLGFSVMDLSDLLRLSQLHLRGSIDNDWSEQGGQFTERTESTIPYIADTLRTIPRASTHTLSLIITLYLADASLNALDVIPWSILVDGLQIPHRKYKSLRVELGFTDYNIPRVISTLEPKLALKRLDRLKEHPHLMQLGDALVFVT